MVRGLLPRLPLIAAIIRSAGYTLFLLWDDVLQECGQSGYGFEINGDEAFSEDIGVAAMGFYAQLHFAVDWA